MSKLHCLKASIWAAVQPRLRPHAELKRQLLYAAFLFVLFAVIVAVI